MPAFGPIGSFPIATLPGGGIPAGKLIFYGTNVTTNQPFLAASTLLFGGGMPLAYLSNKVSWIGAEVLHTGNSLQRTSFIAVEVLRSTASIPTQTGVSWIGLEVLHTGAASDRVSWIGAEVLHTGAAQERVSWIGIEVLRSVADKPPDNGWVSLLAS